MPGVRGAGPGRHTTRNASSTWRKMSATCASLDGLSRPGDVPEAVEFVK
jgi:hypothetical protein